MRFFQDAFKGSERCFSQLAHRIINYHLWLFNKYHYGEFMHHDNIMLLFLIVSLSMVGNLFLLYLNERTGDSNRPFSLTPVLIGWSQIVNLAVFGLSCCFEGFLRNIQMKVKGGKNELIFSPEPGREYIYFGKLLHRIYVNLGLHICRKVVLNSSELLDMREKRPKSRRESKTTRYIPAVLKPSNISYLINDWESEFQDLDECRLCNLSQYISVCEKDESFSLLCSLDPFIKLDAMYAAVLIGNDFCIPFDCATNLYNDPGKYLHRNDYSLQVAKKFVDSLMCILQLFKLVYVEDLELREILTVFHLFKSFAYDTLHYHVHELLTSEAAKLESKNKNHAPCAMSEWPGSKISDYLSSDLSNLTMDLESQNIEFRKLSADLTDVSLLSAVNAKLKENSPTRSQEAKGINKVGNETNIHYNLRVFDNKRWRMLHWRSDLDDIVNVLLDSIVLIPPKETISNLHKMELKLERIETIFLYAESLLLKCMWRNNLCETCIDLDNFERSPWKIPQITMIEERVLIQDLMRNFQTFFLSRETKIEKAINKVEDAIFASLLNAALKETKHILPRPYVNVVAADLTSQAIADAKEEISTEKYYQVFALSRLAFFVGAAKFLNENRDFIVKCPILDRFLEVSQTDLDHSQELMLSLAETIFYKMSQGISEFPAFKRTQYFFEKSQIGAICGRVLSKIQDQITALTFTFLTDIISKQKILRKLNLTSKYVSASLEQFSEQLQRLVMDRFKESMRQQEFSDLCSKRMSFLLRNTVKENWTQTTLRIHEVKISIDTDSATDFEKSPKSFLEVKEQELGLPRSYLSILLMLTYRVWLQDEHSKTSDDFLWQFYLAYFQDKKKPFPHWTKIIIQVFMMSLIMAGFIYLPLNEELLKGDPMKEWFVLSILSLVANALIFESLKVAAICIYQHYFKKEKI